MIKRILPILVLIIFGKMFYVEASSFLAPPSGMLIEEKHAIDIIIDDLKKVNKLFKGPCKPELSDEYVYYRADADRNVRKIVFGTWLFHRIEDALQAINLDADGLE